MYNRKCVNKYHRAKWKVHLHTHRAGFCPDVGRCHKIPGSEIKDFITHGIACDLSIMCMLVLLAPKSYEGDTEAGSDRLLHIQWVCTRAEEPQA